MNRLSTLIRALRTGASVKNPTPLKWAGVAVAVAIIALEVAKSQGVLVDVSETAIIELVMVIVVLYSQIASTDKIGVLPPDRHDPRIDERVRDQSVPVDVHEAIGGWTEEAMRKELTKRHSAGFPDGPFWGDS